jgi:TonB family protein
MERKVFYPCLFLAILVHFFALFFIKYSPKVKKLDFLQKKIKMIQITTPQPLMKPAGPPPPVKSKPKPVSPKPRVTSVPATFVPVDEEPAEEEVVVAKEAPTEEFLEIYEVQELPKIRYPQNIMDYYPPLAKEAGIEGKVVVELVIDRWGVIREKKIVKSSGESFTQAALRLIADAVIVAPAKQGGKPVGVRIKIPIRFNLVEEK